MTRYMNMDPDVGNSFGTLWLFLREMSYYLGFILEPLIF